jgi:hypothetical protein
MEKYALITQEDEWGCGAACVASLLGMSYQEARQLVEEVKGKRLDAKPHGLELHHLAIALQAKGLKVIADWAPDSLPDGAIAFVSGGLRYGEGGHYLLKTPKGWMDPWYNLRKNKEAKYRDDLPRGTTLQVALIPIFK